MEELMKLSVRDLVAPENEETLDDFMKEIRSGGKQHDIDFWAMAGDGTRRYLSTRFTTNMDPASKSVSHFVVLTDMTQRKLMEDTLLESEERFRRMAENIQDGLTIIENGRVVYFNDRACEIFGYPRDELIKKTGIDLAAPEEKERLSGIMKKPDEGGNINELDFWIVRKNGTRRFINNRYSARTEKSGAVTRHFVVTTDITERKAAEDKIQQQATDAALVNRLNDAANRNRSLEEIIAILSDETRRIFASNGATVYLLSDDKKTLRTVNTPIPESMLPNLQNATGMTIPKTKVTLHDGGVYKSILDGRVPVKIDDKETIQVMMSEHTDNKMLKKLVPTIYHLLSTRSVIAVPLVSGDETIGLLDLSRSEPFSDSDMTRISVLSLQIFNILKRKKAEQELAASEDRYRRTLDSMADRIHVVDRDLRILLVNESFKDWLKELALDMDIIGKTVFEAFPFLLAKRVRGEYERVFKTGNVLITEESTELQNGTIATETRKVPIMDNGHVTKIITLVRDITEEKKRQEDILKKKVLEAQFELKSIITDLLPLLLETPLDEKNRDAFIETLSQKLDRLLSEKYFKGLK
ncbi:MAG: PAS domain S-box protein, partial [Candidatus Dadabacteria bacterium]|nr:PAS domain S-box protein [Candidatus Dadabacteria bacterium]